MKFTSLLCLLSAILVFEADLTAEKKTLVDMPPVVIRTFPVSGHDCVDPSLKKIVVTFSQKMQDKSWSWVQEDKESFPEMVGEPSYEKGLQTCVLKVNLEPDKTYAIWINSGRFMNFKGRNGKAAVPYLLSFKTAGKEFVPKKKAAIKCSEDWLKLLSESKFGESWDKGGDFFKTRVKKEAWEKQIGLIYSKLGALKSRKLISSSYKKSLPGAPPGEYFILRFATSFENKPKTIETITPMRDSNGKWQITGYYLK